MNLNKKVVQKQQFRGAYCCKKNMVACISRKTSTNLLLAANTLDSNDFCFTITTYSCNSLF